MQCEHETRVRPIHYPTSTSGPHNHNKSPNGEQDEHALTDNENRTHAHTSHMRMFACIAWRGACWPPIKAIKVARRTAPHADTPWRSSSASDRKKEEGARISLVRCNGSILLGAACSPLSSTRPHESSREKKSQRAIAPLATTGGIHERNQLFTRNTVGCRKDAPYEGALHASSRRRAAYNHKKRARELGVERSANRQARRREGAESVKWSKNASFQAFARWRRAVDAS